ncbi:glycosyltransferase [Nocardioides sp. HDW12B]|uniref:glycosyltransferase n=1 Tax=Nocardioides sp. HDW12B TaxID=2714939 RepID=UPI00140CD427|nr:glycosyltransferase [Nocardioides sp. HDW12B]QIK65373.1 glycosyltransferase [Nocardioides sp. HDW12B]
MTLDDAVPQRRLRVAMSAYGCDPAGGSEPGAGWAFAVAAARHSDVWVFAHPRWKPAIDAVLAQDPELAEHLHVRHVALGRTLTRLRRRPSDVYWYYFLWQRKVGRIAVQMHEEVGFDVAHHVTFATDWMPAGLSRLRDVPLVWGPVGAAARPPVWRLRRWLGARGFVVEVVRLVVTDAVRRVYGDPVARKASVVVAQNEAVARRFAFARRVVLEPNSAMGPALDGVRPGRPVSGRRTALYVGRLIPLKGVRLAIEVMAHPLVDDWDLRLLGDGAELDVLRRRVHELGLTDRVHFLGHLPRTEVLEQYASVDALLFPSFRDQASWAVAEASTAGCPVVCLPLGGSPLLAHVNGYVADLDGDVVENLARELVRAGARGGTPHERWSRDRLPGLVDEWYATARGDAEAG